MKYQFCFDLHFEKILSLYVPVAYVVPNNIDIDYVDKKATPEVLKAYGIDLNLLGTDIITAIEVCKSLQPATILKKFSVKKNFKSYEELLQDTKMQKGVLQYIHFQLDNFFALAQKNDFNLSVNLDADKNFAKHRISISKEPLEAHLVFEKTSTTLHYSLFLKENNQLVSPMNDSFVELREKSSWIVFNKKLVKLEGIDSKNIRPFLKKKTVEIAMQNVPQYFDKFIKNIAKKVDFEASGFESVTKNLPLKKTVNLHHDFLRNQYLIGLQLDYDGYIFEFEKPKNRHSELNLADLNNIKITQFVRNLESENQIISDLQKTGLYCDEKTFFGIQTNEKETYQNVQWLIENKNLLKNKGFEIENITIQGKKLNTENPRVESSKSLKNDWFDLEMTIFCGEISFPFADIIPNIKEKKRLFLLPNDTYFLLPLEWLTTYNALAKMTKFEQGKLRLPKSNFTIIEAIPQVLDTTLGKQKSDFIQSPLIKASLRPYQLEGSKWLWDHFQNGLGACLADDMGLGKTLQTLALLVAVQESFGDSGTDSQFDLFGNQISSSKTSLKALIVLPSSLIFNWYNESKKFTPHFKVLQYIGSDRKLVSKKLANYDLIFTSYSVALRDSKVFENYHFNYLILDESQYIKNKNSETFKKINQIKSDNRISLSGTPIENSLNDLWSQMQFINPNLLGTFDFFVKNYKIPIEKNYDEQALLELKNLIKPFVLRRTKEQVLKDLPEKTEQIFYCEMEEEQAKMYEKEKSQARNFLLTTTDKQTDRLNIINTLMRLRQWSNHPKMIDAGLQIESGKFVAVTLYLESLIQAKKKTIIFSSFVSNLAFYEKWCHQKNIDFCKLTGETKLSEREMAVKRFQENENPLLFFISLKAGGVGLTITKASYVLFLDPWWNPFAEQQGIGRAHRIGQENKLNVIRFISKNTVEEKIIKLQESKKILSDSLLEDDFVSCEIEKHLDFILA
jgi:non-specific serine/threonine protein kinase